MQKHKVTITLKWNSIMRDVKDKTSRISRLIKLGVNDEINSSIYEQELTLTLDDINIIKRAMVEAFSDVVAMCHEYLWHTTHTSDNLTFSDDEDIALTLIMPTNYNLAGNLALGRMMHKYIVASALKVWLNYIATGNAVSYIINETKEDVQQSKVAIINILSQRCKPVRPQAIELIVDDAPEEYGESEEDDDIDISEYEEYN